MFKSLRLKIISLTAAIAVISFSFLIATVYFVSFEKIKADNFDDLNNISLAYLQKLNGKKLPEVFNQNDADIVVFDKSYNLIAMKFSDNSTFTSDSLYTMGDKLLTLNTNQGIHDNELFTITKSNKYFIVAIFDYKTVMASALTVLQNTIFFSVVVVVVMLLFIIWISGIFVKPIKETFLKQEQFVSDASHELKTPLSTINANIAVIENEIGNNKWLNYIKDESVRMNKLIVNLLQLSKSEKMDYKNKFEAFSLSDLILKTILPFESIIFEKDFTLETAVQSNLKILGNKSQIEQLIIIFLDNAIKYSSANSNIKISLQKSKRKICLSISNNGEHLSKQDISQMFERFWRKDFARNTSESYGLGLSIAKSIVKKHRAIIKVNSQNNINTFAIYFKAVK